MIQDIKPYHLHNEFIPGKDPKGEDLVLLFREKEGFKETLLAVDEDKKALRIPKVKEFGDIDKKKLVYIFNVADEDYYLFLGDDVKELDGYAFHTMKDFRREYLLPKHYVFAVYTAYQLDEWYKVTMFCGKCGARNDYHQKERARICPKCGNVIYPRINPAVIIAVTDKKTNKIILTKYRIGFNHNALVAGFTEIGETLEETVEREVMEEVGLKVTNIRYYKSQPWGLASDILAGFYCDVDGDTNIKMDASELKYAEWVSPKDIVLQPLEYSLTNEMMKLFKEKGYEGTLTFK